MREGPLYITPHRDGLIAVRKGGRSESPKLAQIVRVCEPRSRQVASLDQEPGREPLQGLLERKDTHRPSKDNQRAWLKYSVH